ncbi:MAG: cell division protein FtsX [Burkholderiaceae bacterium]
MRLLAAQRYALGRAMAMVRDRPLPFLLGVVLAGSALALPLALASIVWAARPVLAQLQPSPEISVFVSTRASVRDVETLKARLAALPGVMAVTLRPKDTALVQLLQKSGFTTAPGELGVNPLPDVLVTQLAPPVSPDAVETLSTTTKGWPLVDAVRSDLDWYRKLRALGRLGFSALAMFGGLVAVLVALILVGTIRLHAGTRDDEVRVLKLVGATPRFIVRPYAYSAALTLLLASAMAIGVAYFAHAALRAPFADLTALYNAGFTLPDPEPLHLIAVLAGAVIFGWLVGVLGARGALAGR